MSILNNRLLMAANMLKKGKAVADIGTDHAFLPIHIIKEKIADTVLACDIAEGPLSVARANIQKYKLEDKIELRLADGLKGVKPFECEQITICGMGGETIADIITAAERVKSPKVTLVLQPMSCDDRLRDFLVSNNFEIEEERAVISQGRVYTVMRVAYSENKQKTDTAFKYIGKLLDTPDEAAIRFVKRRLKSMCSCMNDIKSVERKKDLFNELCKATEIIEQKLKKAN